MSAGPQGIDPLSTHLGFVWESHDRLSLTVRDDHINAAGLLSGAVSYAMIDYCMGSALWAQLSEGERIATISISVNYVRTAREGVVVCEAAVDRRNDRIAVLRAEVSREDGSLVATAIGSYSIFPKERLGGRERRRPG
jgi:uncharacterized protein (TIGR00369 family)